MPYSPVVGHYTLVPLENLLAICNPVKNPPWATTSPVTRGLVYAALNAEKFRTTPMHPLSPEYADPEQHAMRIAHFMACGYDHPIEIDVGVPSLRCHVDWIVTDGNHRLFAAAMCLHRTIAASIGGDIDHAASLLGVPASEIAYAAEETDAEPALAPNL